MQAMSDAKKDKQSSHVPVPPDERMARLVRLAARGFNRALQLRLQTENVTFGQWIFLRILWQEDGLSQRGRSDRAHLTEATAQGNAQRVLHIIQTLRAEGVEPPVLLWALSRDIRILDGMLSEIGRAHV